MRFGFVDIQLQMFVVAHSMKLSISPLYSLVKKFVITHFYSYKLHSYA